MSDLVGNPEDRFSHVEAHLKQGFREVQRKYVLVASDKAAYNVVHELDPGFLAQVSL